MAISGEPGIGKTRLLTELFEISAERNHLTLSGRAAQLERDVPFLMFVDALDGFLAAQNPRRLEPLGPDRLAELARIFPALSEFGGPGRGAIQAERYRVHHAVGALLELLADPQPLLLGLDDLQWADDASLELVSHLLRRPPKRATIALAYRPGEKPPRLKSTIEDALRDSRIEIVELGPLSEEEAEALSPENIAGELRSQLYRESGGNPFYLEQLSKSIDSGPTPIGARSQPSGPDEVPLAVGAALARELDGLSVPARRLLEGASVVGDPFELELAAAAGDCSGSAARDALDELLVRQLVQPTEAPRRFRFRHPIVHRSVYAGANSGWRLGAHIRVRDKLVTRGAAPSELAHHVEQAAEPGDEDAVAVLEAAGQAALELAPGPAADWLAAALRLLPKDSPRRLELLVPMATSLAASGRLAESRGPLLEAIQLMPPGAEDRVRLVAAAASVDHFLGHHEEASTLLRDAFAGLPDPSSPAGILLQTQLSSDANYTSDFEQARHWGERAMAAADAAGHDALQITSASWLACASMFPGTLSDAERLRVAARNRIESLEDSEIARYIEVGYPLVHLHFFMERYEEGIELARRIVRISRATGQGQIILNLQLTEAWALICAGRAAEATDLIAEPIEAARISGNAQALNWALWVQAWIAGAIGDFDAAFAAGNEACEVGDTLDDNIVTIAGYAHFASVCADAGEYERCVELMARAGAPEFPRFYADRRTHWFEALSRAALGLGREAEAEAWVERGERFVDELDLELPVTAGAIRRARARVLLAQGNPAAAARFALEAAALQDSRDARIEAARSRILAGRALAAAGDRDRGIAELEAAHEELDACEAPRRRDEAARELRRLGRRKPRTAARRPVTTGVDALSEREREIATLVADAKTNREIAATLFISEKTVEKHLTKVFAKLGIKGRAAVGAKLAEEQPQE